MVKIPYGQSDFKALINEGYYYVDKTMYLEKLEGVAKIITYLRPRRFGKSLFTSMLSSYYDIESISEFDKLFKDTYVYNNPTKDKNNYYILKFDFSGIASDNVEVLEESFRKIVVVSVNEFISKYNLSINVDPNQKVYDYIREFLSSFTNLSLDNNIYIIIDEYDNFTNSILNANIDNFKSITGDNSFLKNFYAEIKKKTVDGTVGRVFITGVCSITLDSMTSGFNISTNITNDFRFNSMVGLTHSEVKEVISVVESDKSKADEIYKTMVEYYDGYLFSDELNNEDKVFNSTLVMNLLVFYNDTKKYPKELIDNNIFTGYEKLENLLTIKDNKYYLDIINDILDNGLTEGKIITNLNLSVDFNKDHIISLLYYFGYLSIDTMNELTEKTIFKIPNKVVLDLYLDYFKSLINKVVPINEDYTSECRGELILEGKIDKISNYISEILRLSENRIFTSFDEKYIQMMYFTLLNGNSNYNIYNEYFLNGGYSDLYIKSNSNLCKYDVLIELKYIKKEDYSKKKLKEKYDGALKQINRYINDKRLDTSKLKKYIVIYVKDEIKELKSV